MTDRIFSLLGELPLAYAEALVESLPPGPLWDVEKDESLAQMIVGGIGQVSTAHNRVDQIFPFGEVTPLGPDQMLLEWEDVFGLPDDCAPPSADTNVRIAVLRAAFLAQGGQTPAYYLHLMEQVFGVKDATIDEGVRTAFTVGDGTGTDIPPWSGSVIGDPLWAYSEWFAWRINIPVQAVESADMAARIECLVERVKPAHTILDFNYFYTAPPDLMGYGPIGFGPMGEGTFG